MSIRRMFGALPKNGGNSCFYQCLSRALARFFVVWSRFLRVMLWRRWVFKQFFNTQLTRLCGMKENTRKGMSVCRKVAVTVSTN